MRFFFLSIESLSFTDTIYRKVTTGTGEHKSKLSLICQGVRYANVTKYLAITSMEKNTNL